MRYYTELSSKLCDVNSLIRKTLHSNFFSFETPSAMVDEISQGK